MKNFKISFVTMSGRSLEKNVKAIDYEDAHEKLDIKYNIAYFNDWVEIEQEERK